MKRKGFTLVEILVSLAVFLTIFAGILTTYSLSVKGANKLEEYIYFEKLCLDIDKIYDNEGYKSLKINIFNDSVQGIESTDEENNTTTTTYSNEIYYDASYQISSSTDNSKYKLNYEYKEIASTSIDESSSENTSTTTSSLIISIKNYRKDYYIIENLDYGSSKTFNTSES